MISCSPEEKKQEGKIAAEPQLAHPEQYEAWEVFRYNKIQILHPNDHHLVHSFPQMADWYDKHIPNICTYLGLPLYTDTLHIYYYTGYGQGEAMTGRGYPFATPKAIHFWLPGTYGSTFVEFFLQQWKAGEPKHRFLKEGLKTLFDYSGQNYFAIVRYFQSVDSQLTLRRLVEDPYISSDSERFQSAYAATFADFLNYSYGSVKFKALYQSDEDFENALEETIGLDIDSTEVLWQRFIRESYPEVRFNPEDHKKTVDIPLR